jgi:hypothetical protein
MGVEIEEEREVEEFLGQIITLGGVESYRLMWEFKYIIDRIWEEEEEEEEEKEEEDK